MERRAGFGEFGECARDGGHGDDGVVVMGGEVEGRGVVAEHGLMVAQRGCARNLDRF